MRWSRVGLWASAAGAIAVSGWAWVASPGRVPTHFSWDGTPDEWGSPAQAFIVEVCFLVALTALFVAIPLLMRVLPDELINVPHRDFWLAPERRSRAVGLLARWSDLMGTAVNLLILCASLIIYRASAGPDHAVPAWWFLGLLVTFLVVTALTVVQLERALSRRS